MISVDDALNWLSSDAPSWKTKIVSLEHAVGRYLSEDLIAPFNQPSFSVSIMDGYACKKADNGLKLTIAGESRAGKPFQQRLEKGQAVRIFTGAVLPEGADFIEIQEHAKRDGDTVWFKELSESRNYIRPAGRDFKKGQTLLKEGDQISPADILTLASCNLPNVTVRKPPSVAILRAGDELRCVGSTLDDPSLIIDANGPGMIALLKSWGFDAIDLGIATDDLKDIRFRIASCKADIIVPIGGASVGDYDLMKPAFAAEGFQTVFEKIAVKPGKPTWFAKRNKQCVLGLPGNPTSAWVCAHLFLKSLLGLKHAKRRYPLAVDLPPNGNRETYIRACFTEDGSIQPLTVQDSGIVTPLSATELFIRRKVNAPSVTAKETVECILPDVHHFDFK